ncbi:MAG: hypothetical protein ABI411_17380 [Tahibacter sp.]
MSKLFHGLLFLHGHILDPNLLSGGPSETPRDEPDSASSVARASVSAVPRPIGTDDACLSC